MYLSANIKGQGWTIPKEYNQPERNSEEKKEAYTKRICEHRCNFLGEDIAKVNGFVYAEKDWFSVFSLT